MTRRDKRGRIIGRNWWREYNVTLLRDANDAVEALRETNHQMEPDEFRVVHRLVTLKELLVGNAGMTREPDEAA